MGWLTSLFRGASPEGRVRRAQRLYDRNEYNLARLELEDVPGDEAAALRALACAKLVELNVAEAIAQRNAGNSVEFRGALERARCFGATPEQLREAERGGGDPRTPGNSWARRGRAA